MRKRHCGVKECLKSISFRKCMLEVNLACLTYRPGFIPSNSANMPSKINIQLLWYPTLGSVGKKLADVRAG
jgi:hypothetical protein